MKILIIRKELIEDKGLENFLRARKMTEIARATKITRAYLSFVMSGRKSMSERVYKELLKYRDEQVKREQPTN